MKVSIIQPPALEKIRNDKDTISKYFPSSGINYIYENLKTNQIDCNFYDFYLNSWNDVYWTLVDLDLEIVGITCLTYGRKNTFKMVELIKRLNSNAIIILGGFHATYIYKQILNNYDIDYIIFNEGEKRLLKLVSYLNSSGKYCIDDIDGLAYKKNGTIIVNPLKTYIEDLDNLPFPFSKKNVQLTNDFTTIEKVNPLLAKYLPLEERQYKYMMILTSRGCPYNCQFCSSTKFWGRRWRYRSAKNVVEEIEHYYNNFNVRYFEFIDDAFTINEERAIEICKLIIERGLKIRFNCRTRANAISHELVFWLKNAGCIAAGLGVESGSEKILKTINKNIKIETIVESFSIFKAYDIIAYPYIMIGNPGETKKTIKETINLLKIIKPKFMAVSITTVYPETGLFNLAKEQGFISDDYWLTDKLPPYYTYEHSLKQLDKWVFKVMNCNKLFFVKFIHLIFKKFPFTLKLFKKIIKRKS